MSPLKVYIDGIRAVWGKQAPKIVSGYRDAFKTNPDALRDLAAFAHVGTTVPDGELPRIEGRREMFWRIMALIEGDPVAVAKFLEGEDFD